MKKHALLAAITISLVGSPLLGFAKSDKANAQNNPAIDQDVAQKEMPVSPDERKAQKLQDQQDRKAAQQMNKDAAGDKKAMNEQQRFENAKVRSLAAIDKRITKVTEALNRLTSRKRMRLQEQALLNAEIEKALAALATAKSNVEAATDIETLKKETRATFDNIAVNAVVVPKIKAMAMTSSLYNAVDRMEKVFPKVEALIAKHPDISTQATPLLNEAKDLVVAAELKANQAWSEFASMTPAQDKTAAKQHFQAGKTLLKDARDQIHKAVMNLNQIKAMVPETELTDDTDADETEATETETEGTKPVKNKVKKNEPVEEPTPAPTPVQ